MLNKKILFFYMLTSLISTSINARENFLCSLYYASDIVEKVQDLTYDKTKHCSVSCMLAKRCGQVDALELGVLKEVNDLFGPGEADLRDISADIQGVKFGLARTTKTDNHCIQLCSKSYVQPEEAKI